MEINKIKTEDDYKKALERLEKIFHAKPVTNEREELEALVLQIEKYENETVGKFPDPKENRKK